MHARRAAAERRDDDVADRRGRRALGEPAMAREPEQQRGGRAGLELLAQLLELRVRPGRADLLEQRRGGARRRIHRALVAPGQVVRQRGAARVEQDKAAHLAGDAQLPRVGRVAQQRGDDLARASDDRVDPHLVEPRRHAGHGIGEGRALHVLEAPRGDVEDRALDRGRSDVESDAAHARTMERRGRGINGDRSRPGPMPAPSLRWLRPSRRLHRRLVPGAAFRGRSGWRRPSTATGVNGNNNGTIG